MFYISFQNKFLLQKTLFLFAELLLGSRWGTELRGKKCQIRYWFQVFDRASLQFVGPSAAVAVEWRTPAPPHAAAAAARAGLAAPR